MGQQITRLIRRADGEVQEVDLANGNAYKWPPTSGNYFGSHFIMGGERFDTQQPEAFLFGENTDLNFLGSRPSAFPYPTPSLNEPTRTLRSLVNIRKDSIKLIRADLPEKPECETEPEANGAGDGQTEAAPPPDAQYNIEFTFDSDVTCKITVFYFANEEMVNGEVKYIPRDPSMNSETYKYKSGANQVFSQSSHVIIPSKFTEEEWQYDVAKDEIPVILHCVVDEPGYMGHSHVTLCVLEKLSDGYNIKSIKQKQCVDGLLYMLQEFYGIENKENKQGEANEDDLGDNTAECVICMSDLRDTLILPCRHLCLCNGCADSLRYQHSNCPICRSPFRALLQLRAIRKKKDDNDASDDEDDLDISQEGVPAGYKAISLIEALNGPCLTGRSSGDPRSRVLASQASLRRSKKSRKDKRGSRMTLKDKLKDEEEKVQDITTDKQDEPVEVATEENTTGSELKESDEQKVSQDSEGRKVSKDPDNQKASEPGLLHAAEKDEKTERADDQDPADEQDLPEAGSDAESDSLGHSINTNFTALPGTPDNALTDRDHELP